MPLAFATFSGQAKIAVTGTAVQFGARPLTNGLVVTAPAGNSASITVGGSAALTNVTDGTGNGYVLAAGQSTPLIQVANASEVWINGTATNLVSWIGN